MRSIYHAARRLAITLAALVLAALGPQALAYYNCSYSVTVYASGGQSCSRICHFYDNETNQYQGSISMEFQC